MQPMSLSTRTAKKALAAPCLHFVRLQKCKQEQLQARPTLKFEFKTTILHPQHPTSQKPPTAVCHRPYKHDQCSHSKCNKNELTRISHTILTSGQHVTASMCFICVPSTASHRRVIPLIDTLFATIHLPYLWPACPPPPCAPSACHPQPLTGA